MASPYEDIRKAVDAFAEKARQDQRAFILTQLSNLELRAKKKLSPGEFKLVSYVVGQVRHGIETGEWKK